jgi:hypothetical protein
MRKRSAFLWYWLPVAAWMVIIFSASSDRGSFGHSSRIVAPFLRWLIPGISDAAIHATVVAVRKGAHLTEFAILALLVWRALRWVAGKMGAAWDWPLAGKAIAVVIVYAASDEFHQLFVPSREGTVRDVIIDTLGGVCGLLMVWMLGKWLGWWSRGEKANTEKAVNRSVDKASVPS